MSLDKAYNYRQVSEQVATAGRVEPEQLATLDASGVEVVINLMPDSSQYAVPGERDIVEGQGVEYRYLPVDFAAPTLADYRQFEQLMDAVGARKVLIHCAANWRVSAFYSRYAIARGIWSLPEADAFMLSIWRPEEHPPWARLLEEISCQT